MKTRRSQTTITNLRWGAFVFILLILVIQVMPRAWGQRGQRVGPDALGDGRGAEGLSRRPSRQSRSAINAAARAAPSVSTGR